MRARVGSSAHAVTHNTLSRAPFIKPRPCPPQPKQITVDARNGTVAVAPRARPNAAIAPELLNDK
jgi:hypothetical protein